MESKFKLSKYLPTKFEIIPSKQLSYVLGVLLGDGTVYKTRRVYPKKVSFGYMISLSVRNESFAKKFAKNLSEIFNKEVKVYKCDEKKGRGIFYKVFVSSKQFYNWYSREKAIKFGIKFPKHFLSGFYESEGSLGYFTSKYKNKIYKYKGIRIINSDIELLNIIKNILKQRYNIDSKTYDRGFPKSTTLVGRKVKWKKRLYRLGIFKKGNVSLFLRIINKEA